MEFFHQYHTTTQIIRNRRITFQPHLHNEVEIIALYNGRADVVVDGKTYTMTAGNILIVFPNVVHSYATDSEVEVGKFIFSPATLPELSHLLTGMLPETPLLNTETVSDLLPLTLEITQQYPHSSEAVQKAYLLLLTGKLLERCRLQKRPAAERDVISQVFAYCRENFRRKLTQKEVATALHISESHLSHIFCCKMKINFCQYLNNLRLNEACRLLTETDRTVLDIAEESGFSSLRSFNRAFLQHRGVTPSQYRQGLTKEN